MITGTQSITMTYQKFFTTSFKFFRMKINRDIQFGLQVILHPHIMIAYKKMHGYTSIGKFSQFSQYPYIPFRHYFAIFIPEIKHIANDENLLCVMFDTIQKLNDYFLPCKTGSVIGSSK